MTTTIWTEERVKDELPDVQVTFGGKHSRYSAQPVTVITCMVSGRKNKFATVRPFEHGSATTFEFSWAAVAHSLNMGQPLLV